MKNTDQPIIIKEHFDAPIPIVWQAITELKQMKQWFFKNIESFKPEVGFETTFMVENEGRQFPHIWKITEVIPQKKIAYNWQYEGYQGDSMVSFKLIPYRNQTKLTLTHTVVESFDDHIPEFTRASCQAGWEFFIQQNLKEYLKRGVKATAL